MVSDILKFDKVLSKNYVKVVKKNKIKV